MFNKEEIRIIKEGLEARKEKLLAAIELYSGRESEPKLWEHFHKAEAPLEKIKESE